MIGGSHVSFWDENALNESPAIDVIVRREGENTFQSCCNALQNEQDFADVLGTTIRGQRRPSSATKTDPSARFGFTAFTSIPPPAAGRFHRMGKTIFPIVTSRGCVQWCDFCSTVRMFGRGYRVRSPKKVVDDMEALHNKYGESQFTFYDDAFTINRNHTLEMCADIKDRGLNVEWDCETRVDAVDKELLENMADAGCITIWFGVESGSTKILGQDAQENQP